VVAEDAAGARATTMSTPGSTTRHDIMFSFPATGANADGYTTVQLTLTQVPL
jgi:hypothetical protein